MYSKLMVFHHPDSSVCPEQRRNYMSERSGLRSSRRSWRKWRGIYPCTQALQEEVRLPPQRQNQLRLPLLFRGQQSTSQSSGRLGLIVVTISFQTRKTTDLFLIFQSTHIRRNIKCTTALKLYNRLARSCLPLLTQKALQDVDCKLLFPWCSICLLDRTCQENWLTQQGTARYLSTSAHKQHWSLACFHLDILKGHLLNVIP